MGILGFIIVLTLGTGILFGGYFVCNSIANDWFIKCSKIDGQKADRYRRRGAVWLERANILDSIVSTALIYICIFLAAYLIFYGIW